MSRVTLQSIADHLGLSKFAVSRALAGKSGVSEDTRRAILTTAEQFGYLARKRAGPALGSIEIIFHDRDIANSELWINVQQGAQAEAARSGHPTAVRWTQQHGIIAELEPSAAGFVLVGPQEPSMVEATQESGLPCVMVGGFTEPLDTMDRIGAADAEAGAFVGKYLSGLGHRRLLYAHGRPGLPGRLERLRGFRDALSLVEGATYREMAFDETHGDVGFREAFLDLIEAGFEPTAIFCGNDGVAVTVVSELARLGLRVPEDISVVGFADYACATQIAPKLTTIRMPSQEMGIAAVRLLLARAGHRGPPDDLPPQRVMLVQRLVERDSTAAPNPRSWRSRLRS
ncbi:MAG: LacI family DNA-binding transcriptional regulator [Inquilinus sp.]|uniref:LacI family DNA-binding transcriptional regulator n=1 Tax=Inquilinus sp. TaxID=1932117 RepID=UPI003F29FB93